MKTLLTAMKDLSVAFKEIQLKSAEEEFFEEIKSKKINILFQFFKF
jgi:hypothetical protein